MTDEPRGQRPPIAPAQPRMTPTGQVKSLAIRIRAESPRDAPGIQRVTTAAFLNAPHSSHTEQYIVSALRKAGQLTISRVAVRGEEIVGHIAISPIRVSGAACGWHGLGPISVLPDWQRRGIGSALVTDAFHALTELGAAGCVVFGNPGFYARFGFKTESALTLPGAPPAYFMAISFGAPVPVGVVSYHEAFDARS